MKKNKTVARFRPATVSVYSEGSSFTHFGRHFIRMAEFTITATDPAL